MQDQRSVMQLHSRQLSVKFCFFFFHIINDNVMELLQHYKTDDYQTCFDHLIFLLTLIRTKRKVHSNTNYQQAGQIHRPFHGHYSFKIRIKYKHPFLCLWFKKYMQKCWKLTRQINSNNLLVDSSAYGNKQKFVF